MDEPIPADSVAGDLLLRAAEAHHETTCPTCKGVRRLVRVQTGNVQVMMLFCRCLTSSNPRLAYWMAQEKPDPIELADEPDPMLGL